MKLTLLVCLVLSSILFGLEPEKVAFKTFNYGHSFSKGLRRNPQVFKEMLKSARHKEYAPAVVVPGSLDLTAKVSPPENQGSCGSCWAFSITKALRSEYMLAGIDPGALAFNYLVSNCGGVVNEMGCNGGDFPAGQNMLNGKGPWLESLDPYRQRRSGCPSGLSVSGTAITWNVVGSGNAPANFQELAAATHNNGNGHVLSIDVAVCGQWESYQSGIFNSNQCGANRINHMINMVGYSCETSVDKNGNCLFNANGQPVNGDGYLKVMNNWGTSWGEAGYMRTRWGVDAIANTAMFFEVNRPAPPAPPAPVGPNWESILKIAGGIAAGLVAIGGWIGLLIVKLGK